MDLDSLVLSQTSILKRIDEYELYCHYLGFDPEIRETYSSPIREGDNSPSFSFYNAYPNSDVEFLWKDNMLDLSGSIVQLVQYMYGLTYVEALQKIDSDFKLGFTDGSFNTNIKKLIIKSPQPKEKAVIEISSKDKFTKEGLKFWLEFGISKDTLKLYNVTQLNSLSINNNFTFCGKRLQFAYRIGTRYKIYSPEVSKFKFLNNFLPEYAEGFAQLPCKSKLLIITKSLKDVMVLHELGYEAISPRSESTVLPKEYFKWIKTKYERVVVLFDNDMKHNGDKYPYNKLYIPKESQCKDISDYMKMYKKEKTEWMLKKILK